MTGSLVSRFSCLAHLFLLQRWQTEPLAYSDADGQKTTPRMDGRRGVEARSEDGSKTENTDMNINKVKFFVLQLISDDSFMMIQIPQDKMMTSCFGFMKTSTIREEILELSGVPESDVKGRDWEQQRVWNMLLSLWR